VGTILMVQEYHRLLDEAKYANPIFWFLNLVSEVLVVIVLKDVIWTTSVMAITALINLAVNLSLLILMFFTTKHNLRYRSPLIIDYPDEEYKPYLRDLATGKLAFKI